MEEGSVPEERLQHFYSVLHLDPGLKFRVSVIVRSLAKGFGWRDTVFLGCLCTVARLLLHVLFTALTQLSLSLLLSPVGLPLMQPRNSSQAQTASLIRARCGVLVGGYICLTDSQLA